MSTNPRVQEPVTPAWLVRLARAIFSDIDRTVIRTCIYLTVITFVATLTAKAWPWLEVSVYFTIYIVAKAIMYLATQAMVYWFLALPFLTVFLFIGSCIAIGVLTQRHAESRADKLASEERDFTLQLKDIEIEAKKLELGGIAETTRIQYVEARIAEAEADIRRNLETIGTDAARAAWTQPHELAKLDRKIAAKMAELRTWFAAAQAANPTVSMAQRIVTMDEADELYRKAMSYLAPADGHKPTETEKRTGDFYMKQWKEAVDRILSEDAKPLPFTFPPQPKI